MARFIERLERKGVNAKDLMARINKPILFQPTHGGRLAFGYEAEVLPEVCEFVLECHDKGAASSATAAFLGYGASQSC